MFHSLNRTTVKSPDGFSVFYDKEINISTIFESFFLDAAELPVLLHVCVLSNFALSICLWYLLDLHCKD